MFDAAGRQVFARGSSAGLLVVEGSRGPSNRDPGERLLVNGELRPDLQVLVGQDLGIGNPEPCDAGPPPTPFGGVPGFDPPSFGPGQDVTTALQDMACRFSLQRTTGDACTRTSLGLFGFLGEGSRKQFCFPVPLAEGFNAGDTIVAVQLLDSAGNLGPKKEIVVRVEP
jgi:hypothetical protein